MTYGTLLRCLLAVAFLFPPTAYGEWTPVRNLLFGARNVVRGTVGLPQLQRYTHTTTRSYGSSGGSQTYYRTVPVYRSSGSHGSAPTSYGCTGGQAIVAPVEVPVPIVAPTATNPVGSSPYWIDGDGVLFDGNNTECRIINGVKRCFPRKTSRHRVPPRQPLDLAPCTTPNAALVVATLPRVTPTAVRAELPTASPPTILATLPTHSPSPGTSVLAQLPPPPSLLTVAL